jgi:hypothetical protein
MAEGRYQETSRHETVRWICSRVLQRLPNPAPAAPWARACLIITISIVLSVLAAQHPTLRFVDFIRFSERARQLWLGAHLTDPLYPIGYPAVLALLAPVCGSALIAGKAISVLSGVILVAAVASRLGGGAALWVLSGHAMLLAGTSEGTDLPALSLALAAVLWVERPILSAALLSGALLMRYTAVAAVPVVLLLSKQRLRTLLTLTVLTAPHWAVALYTGASVLPDQSQNMAIAAGSPVPLLSLDTLRRWPGGFGRALLDGAGQPLVMLSALGFVPALLRRDRRAWALIGFALLHAAALGLGFSNARLALPITACVALGAAWLVPPRLLGVAAIVVGALSSRVPGDNDREAERAGGVANLLVAHPELSGPLVCTSPWCYRFDGVWIEGGIQLSGLGGGPRMEPNVLAAKMRTAGATVVALETGRTRRQAPGLAPLLSNRAPDGWESLGAPRGWHVWILSRP